MQITSVNNNIRFCAKKPQKHGAKKPEILKKGDFKSFLTGLTALGTVMGVLLKDDTAKLADIDFNKGIANLNGKKFTGTIKDVLKSGDEIILKYKDGVIQSSRKTKQNGEVINKYWQYFEDGSHRIGTFTTANKTVRHASYQKNPAVKKGPGTYSLIEENFDNNTAKELARLSQNGETGVFINTAKDGRIYVGEKKAGVWSARLSTQKDENIQMTTVVKNGKNISTFK